MTFARFAASGSQATGTEENGPASVPCLMVRIATGSPSWVVVHQGSVDGVNWTTMQTHDSATNTSGEIVFSGAERYPSLKRRLYCVSCSGGEIEAFGWAL